MDYRASEYLIPIFDFDVLHMQLNTPIYIFVLVLIVMFFMNKFLFKPVLSSIDQRRSYLDGLDKTAKEQQAEIAELITTYEAKLDLARKEVAQIRADSRREAERNAKIIISGAQQEADAEFRQACQEFKKEVEAVRDTLENSTQALAEQTTTRILG